MICLFKLGDISRVTESTEQTPGIAFILGSFLIKLDSINNLSGFELDLKTNLVESQFGAWSVSLT